MGCYRFLVEELKIRFSSNLRLVMAVCPQENADPQPSQLSRGRATNTSRRLHCFSGEMEQVM